MSNGATQTISAPKVIIGLGNPGPQFTFNRHNIGFLVVDALASAHGGQWKKRDAFESAQIAIDGSKILLIKPQTYMNQSALIIPSLKKQGFGPEDALVIHDELEQPFSKLSLRMGGSARGHNGLKSLISQWGESFARLRFGIGRPERKEDVPDYVLENFENREAVDELIAQSVALIEKLYTP